MLKSQYHKDSEQQKCTAKQDSSCLPVQNEDLECIYRNKTSGDCELWNSGFSKCSHQGCTYKNSNLYRSCKCVDCAYFYEDQCRHPEKPCQGQLPLDTAEYCTFYVDKTSHLNEFLWIRRCVERLKLTTEKISDEKLISDGEKYIIQAKNKMKNMAGNSDEYKFLKEAIVKKETSISQLESEVQQIASKLSIRGGELMEWPKQK